MTTAFEDRPETAKGRARFRLLLEIHKHIRHDLDTVQRLAREVLGDLPAEHLMEELERLKTNGMLWRLEVDCLRYCSFVHLHHRLEESELFTDLVAANGELEPVVTRLKQEHRQVSDDLDAIEAAARELEQSTHDFTRNEVSGALRRLRENLLSHLDFEELKIEPTMSRLGSDESVPDQEAAGTN